MKSDMFAGGLDASLSVRISPLASVLRNFNVECNIIPPIDWECLVNNKLGNFLSVALTHHFSRYVDALCNSSDVAIIGRTSTPQMYLLQKFLKHRNKKVIFDLNDALFLPTGNLFGANIRSGSFFLEKSIKNADFVTVNGHYLLKYVKLYNKNSAIIHDPIDLNLFTPTKSKNHSNKVTIGWHGNPKMHYENLQMLVNPLSKLAQKYDIKFKIVSYLGDMKVKQIFKTLENVVDVDYGLDHWVSLDKYPKLLSDFDIMVAPLQKTLWYEGKSALRVGTGMSMGIPVVASPVGEQKHIINHGINGFLVEKEADWYIYLSNLIEDPALRNVLGERARKTVEKDLSLSVCGRKLYNIMRNVVD